MSRFTYTGKFTLPDSKASMIFDTISTVLGNVPLGNVKRSNPLLVSLTRERPGTPSVPVSTLSGLEILPAIIESMTVH